MPGRKVLVITLDALGDRMAGPAIRAWNIASVLAGEHDVRLAGTDVGQLDRPPFPVFAVGPHDLPEHADWAEIIILQGGALEHLPALRTDRTKIVVCDLSDPKYLAQVRDLEHDVAAATVRALSAQLERADLVLCASERQRHLWIGHLSALGRLTPALYDADPTLRSLFAVVPDGLLDQPARRTGPGPRAQFDGIGAEDFAPLVAFCRDPRLAPDRLIPAPRPSRQTIGQRLRADARLTRQYLADGGPLELARRAAGRLLRLTRRR